MLFCVKASQIVVASAAAYAADTGQVPQYRFIYDSRVVIEPAGNGNIQLIKLSFYTGCLHRTTDGAQSFDSLLSDFGALQQRI